MGKNSKIEWCHHTFNPWIGCAKVSAGCTNCYAEAMMDTRWGRVKWGPDGTRDKTSDSYWLQPGAWNFQAQKTSVRHRVFCGSLCDVFEDRDELIPWRYELGELTEQTPNLNWLLLTKRPENISKLTALAIHCPNNVWLGVSVEDQETADRRIPVLLQTKPSVRFLSIEPLLGPIDLNPFLWANQGFGFRREHSIDWMIVGGESGPKARSFDIAWLSSIFDQCQKAGVPLFVKQDSGMRAGMQGCIPDELWIQEFPR